MVFGLRHMNRPWIFILRDQNSIKDTTNLTRNTPLRFTTMAWCNKSKISRINNILQLSLRSSNNSNENKMKMNDWLNLKRNDEFIWINLKRNISIIYHWKFMYSLKHYYNYKNHCSFKNMHPISILMTPKDAARDILSEYQWFIPFGSIFPYYFTVSLHSNIIENFLYYIIIKITIFLPEYISNQNENNTKLK